MTQRLDKINKPHDEIGSRPKLEFWHKWAQGPINIKTKKVAQTKCGVYNWYCELVYCDSLIFQGVCLFFKGNSARFSIFNNAFV